MLVMLILSKYINKGVSIMKKCVKAIIIGTGVIVASVPVNSEDAEVALS